ncbi:esterase/lipase family protein [Novilysobacter ciconiae]|uniref:esterase/lipase family protein n=1 Tax=Novilysobacter ciconiae TaxID=2781022 RepID=UPI001D1685FE|nr:alpha/beta hydrolase [Lysobacter ciconiae]
MAADAEDNLASTDHAGGPGRRVLLLHGLWMPSACMAWHARRLRRAGFDPQLFGYDTVGGGPARAIPGLVEALRDPADVLAHSLGGLIAVRALEREPGLPVRRVVCLGTPLAGSAAATGMAQLPLLRGFLGRSARLLRRGCHAWEGDAELGVVAGNSGLGLGRFFGDFAGASDGTVAIAETCVPGLADHIVLPTSHSGMLVSAPVSRQVIAFLRTGRFVHDR